LEANKLKKLVTLLLAMSMVVTLGATTLAKTMGVNVAEGYSVSLERPDFDVDSYKLTGNFGVSDDILVWMAYETEDSDNYKDGTTSLGLRYEFMENVAGIFEYETCDNYNQFAIGARGKYALSDPLALVGEAKYLNRDPDGGDSYGGFNLKGQAEYVFSQMVTGNAGIEYNKMEDYDSTTTYLAGLEFHPTEQVSCWVDYKNVKDGDDSLGAGIGFKF
jgi:hypothetical protein